MSEIKLETLTSVHIGSGDFLNQGVDFVSRPDDIYVIDINKVFNLIGEKNVSSWVAMIDSRIPIEKIMEKFAPGTDIKDYSKYHIDNFASITKTDTLKTIVRDGRGCPYIPGSSIKGAIRTSILSFLAAKEDSSYINNNYRKLEKELFGNNPNSDVFRFIRVSDAYFADNGSVIAIKLHSLNIRDSEDELHDEKMNQLEEAIRQEEETTFSLNIDSKTYDFVKSHWNENDSRIFGQLGSVLDNLRDVPSLFKVINIQTKKLIESEIDLWKNCEKDGADDYIINLKDLLETANNCQDGKQCVLRIGHGSGWRFTTGAWTERLDDFDYQVVNNSRPKNREYYYEYPFPKTRRIEEDGDYLLGFIKLTLK